MSESVEVPEWPEHQQGDMGLLSVTLARYERTPVIPGWTFFRRRKGVAQYWKVVPGDPPA